MSCPGKCAVLVVRDECAWESAHGSVILQVLGTEFTSWQRIVHCLDSVNKNIKPKTQVELNVRKQHVPFSLKVLIH